MTRNWSESIRSAVASALAKPLGGDVSAKAVRLPNRAYAAGFYCMNTPFSAGAELPACPFGALFGAPLISEAAVLNGWLLMNFSDDFYSAAANEVIRALPAPKADLGSYAINRMCLLANSAQEGCPADRSVQRALLNCLLIGHGVSVSDAENAVLRMFHHLPPKERSAVSARSGAVGAAAARLLYAAILPERNEIE